MADPPNYSEYNDDLDQEDLSSGERTATVGTAAEKDTAGKVSAETKETVVADMKVEADVEKAKGTNPNQDTLSTGDADTLPGGGPSDTFTLVTITVKKGSLPTTDRFQVAFTSTDIKANKGVLNQAVARIYGEPSAWPSSNQLKDTETAIMTVPPSNLLCFVVTVSRKRSTGALLRQNLQTGLAVVMATDWGTLHPQVWLPLMGTGDGRLLPLRSLEITLSAIDTALPRSKMHIDKLHIELSLTPEITAEDLADAITVLQSFDAERDWVQVDLSGLRPSEAYMETEAAFHHDGPARQDLLNFAPTVEALRVFLSNREQTRTPISIAVDGPWGSGKSTFMLHLRKALAGDGAAPGRLDYSAEAVDGNWLTSSLKILWNCLFVYNWQFKVLGSAQRRFGRRAVVEGRRAFETAYVNVWRMQSVKSIPAGIVHQLIQDLTVRKGLSFQVRLGLARFNRWRLLALLSSRLLGNVFTLSLLAVAALAAAYLAVGAGFDIKKIETWSEGGPFAVTLFLFVNGLIGRLTKSPVQFRLSDFIRKPNYVDLVGPDTEVEQDFQRILQVLRDEGKTLALFVDDLDRCSPKDTARIVEALNVFFAREGEENCIFILGLHRDLVAVNLEIAYGDLVAKVDTEPALAAQRPYGRRFLEKLAQLVVQVPVADENTIARYVGGLSGRAAIDVERAVRDRIQRHAADPEPPRPADDAQWQNDESALHAQGVSPEQIAEVEAAIQAENERIAAADRIEENDAELQEIFALVRVGLQNSPRQYKRFFNLFRLNNFIAAAAYQPDPDERRVELLRLAKLTVLALEFPAVEGFAREEGLERLAELAADIEMGQRFTAPAGTLARKVVHYLHDHRPLRELLLLN